jgi:hypothetical protein
VTSKVLKVLKVLNFSGDGEGNTFTCTFTGAAAPWLGAKRPSLQPGMTLTPALSLCAGRGDVRPGAAVSGTYKPKFV